MVKLSKDHSDDKLVCISLNVDSQSDDLFSKSLKFLKKEESYLKNFVLTEPDEVWTEHFDIFGLPGLFVYGKDGKRSEAFVDYEDLQKELDKHLQN